MADNSKLNTPEVVVVASAAVAVIASFVPFVDVGPFSANAWDEGFFPTYTWPAIFGVVMAGVILVSTFSTARPPERVIGFTWPQIHLVLGAFSLLISFSALIAGEEHAAGFWLTFLASIGLLTGAVMLGRDEGDAVAGRDSAAEPSPEPGPGPEF